MEQAKKTTFEIPELTKERMEEIARNLRDSLPGLEKQIEAIERASRVSPSTLRKIVFTL